MSAVLEQESEVQQRPSITLLCEAGDLTITWDESNKDQVLEYARKKMEEGYTFFIIKPKKVFGFQRDAKHRVTEDNFDKLAQNSKGIVIPDETLNDLIDDGVVELSREDRSQKYETERMVRKPEEIIRNKTLAVRQLIGG